MAKQALSFDDLSVRQQTIRGVATYRLKPWPSEKPDPDKHAHGNPGVQRYGRWKRIQTTLQDFDQHVAAIRSDNKLSSEGKFEAIHKLKSGIKATFAQLSQSLDPAMAQLEMLDNRINAEIDLRLSRNAARHTALLQWMAVVPAEMRGDAWRYAKIDGDIELYESVLAMNPTIRKVMLPTIKSDADVAELRAKVAEVAAPGQVAERDQLRAESLAIGESLIAAEKYLNDITI